MNREIHQKNNLTLPAQELILMTAISFTKEDLQANKRGIVTSNQKQKLAADYQRKFNQTILWLVISFSLTTLTVILTILFNSEGMRRYFRDSESGQPEQNSVSGLLCGFIFCCIIVTLLLAVASIMMWGGLHRILANQQIFTVEGKLTKARDNDFNVLKIKNEVFDAFLDGQNYRIFYTPALGKEILSVEII